jgi:hypothetical protein
MLTAPLFPTPYADCISTSASGCRRVAVLRLLTSDGTPVIGKDCSVGVTGPFSELQLPMSAFYRLEIANQRRLRPDIHSM